MSSRGGKREGAGRKAGALTTKTRALADAINASGDTPLDTLNELRAWSVKKFRTAVEAKDEDGATKAAAFAADIAHKQAPFVHAKLASVEAKVEHEGEVGLITAVEFLVVDPASSPGR